MDGNTLGHWFSRRRNILEEEEKEYGRMRRGFTPISLFSPHISVFLSFHSYNSFSIYVLVSFLRT